MLSAADIDKLFETHSALAASLEYSFKSEIITEIPPNHGYLLVIGIYLPQYNITKNNIELIANSAIDVLDRRSIWKPFTRICITIATVLNSTIEKICYLEANRGKLNLLKKMDLFSLASSDRTKGVFVGWPASPLVKRILK